MFPPLFMFNAVRRGSNFYGDSAQATQKYKRKQELA